QIKRRRDAVVGSVEAGRKLEAERSGRRLAAIEGMREGDPKAASYDGLLTAQRLPREAEAGAEIIPVGAVGIRREAVHTREAHDARRARHWIDRVQIKAVHAIVYVDDRRVGLPAYADVQRQPAVHRPIVLRVSGQVPTVP